MEKAKISSYQLFVLMVLFQLGSALLVPIGMEAKQDAWLAILMGMTAAFILMYIYDGLYRYNEGKPLTEFLKDILGNFLGRFVAFLYVLYFVYLAARVLRDLGVALLTFAYPFTPLFVVNGIFILVVIYTVYKGVEVIARTGELLVVLEFLLAVTFIILIVVSGLIQVSNLKPVLEEGVLPVIKVALKETVYFPFGEVIVFLMIFPYLKQPEKIKKVGIGSIALSGIFLSLFMAINISVIGINLTARSHYPLLTVIQSIELTGFLERLDIYFLVLLVIGMFFKISVFAYAAVTGAASVFSIKKPSRLAYPIGMVILLLSIVIASNYSEHISEGVNIVPLYIHLPFQVIMPLFLLVIASFKYKKKSKTADEK
ncbi:spore gernimation protein KB [Jeotgalibacillus sp. S-D1]|uniref:GerAB/ArcD/ProY family transporter n=1 Tax=Jeotgalibacillus sp. S-D1 TaxID=2552189 RepID=UPI00105A7CB7|nr:GerAB/ArcD/ProY family transporter [Jeotgalibacillus sp. S-D1]TDL32737.1 spore gernimation protein KB [Jeotgalibacillus sp. S-D1]